MANETENLDDVGSDGVEEEILAKVNAGGAFASSLKRTNKQIRDERARQIASSAERTFRRAIEDIEEALESKVLEKAAMLDMSPNNTQSILRADAIDSAKFVSRYSELSLEIRELKIKRQESKKDYVFLFEGGE